MRLCIHLLHLLFVILLNYSVAGQNCTRPGQNPSTAFPVCGTNVFTQLTVPVCGGRNLPSPSCRVDAVNDKNPFWYKFTAFQTGTLGFLITPKDRSSDYDWELYDVTGKDPNEIYTNGTLVVASNWSGEKGLTGASAAGTQRFVCAGPGKPLFSAMPTVQAGHNYLLLISHFSDTQFGYDLSFGGGSAVITDPNAPRMVKAEPSCTGDIITVKLSKKIKCSSLAADGSDFLLSPASSRVAGATAVDCSAKFDTDSIRIRLNQLLAPGKYTINVKKGNDGNTLLDYCDEPVPSSDVVSFTVLPNSPTPIDSIAPLSCAPNTLRLVFNNPMSCGSIAADGSDFVINGPYAVGISNVSTNCSGTTTTTREITINLSRPLQRAGDFTIMLRRGSDGNTIINECGTETPAASKVMFSVKDTVNADFSYSIKFGCKEDTVNFLHTGPNDGTTWNWNLDDNMRSNQQSPQGIYRVFDEKNIELILSNGFCSDTSKQTVMLDNALKADFSVFEDNCHSEPVFFKSNSTGKILQKDWSFGDGLTGLGDSILHTYAPPVNTTTYKVRHTVTDIHGCRQTIEKPVNIYINCQIDVPNAFTPDGNAKNDRLYPLNAIKAEQLEFKVYNRWGQLLFQTNNWKNGWDGRFHGKLQPAGSYVWVLHYVHRDTKQRIHKKGVSMLIQ